jgi:hypothetical protein
MTPGERKTKLNEILKLLQSSGYVYEKSKGGVHGKTQMPPPPGTKMNCESAARIFMQLAKDMGIDNLQPLFFKGGDKGYGYFVPASGKLALGCRPEIETPAVKGWEFDNHWRVKDPTTGQIYDPTFGTSGQNPAGILGTAMETDKNFNMTTVYGEKYRVKRQGVRVECTELSKGPPNPKYAVTDASFVPKNMTNLR